MTDFLIALAGLARGLWWVGAFAALILAGCFAVSGGIGIFIFIDTWLEKWHVRRGHVRVLDPQTGRERWIPVAPATVSAIQRTAGEIRNLPEAPRG